MRIKLPKDISQLKIAHIFEISKLEQEEAHTVEQMVNYVALLSNTPKENLMEADINDIQAAYFHCLKVLNEYEPKQPPKKVTVKGVEYRLVPTVKQKGGWYIDVKANSDKFVEEPELVPAFCYIEKGMKYSQKDKNGDIENPLRERAKIFRDYFPADVFMDLNGFFLQRLEILTNGFLILNRERVEEQIQEIIQEVK